MWVCVCVCVCGAVRCGAVRCGAWRGVAWRGVAWVGWHVHVRVIFFVFLAFVVFTYGHFVEYMNMHAMS